MHEAAEYAPQTTQSYLWYVVYTLPLAHTHACVKILIEHRQISPLPLLSRLSVLHCH